MLGVSKQRIGVWANQGRLNKVRDGGVTALSVLALARQR
jgi:hypothetical protein